MTILKQGTLHSLTLVDLLIGSLNVLYVSHRMVFRLTNLVFRRFPPSNITDCFARCVCLHPATDFFTVELSEGKKLNDINTSLYSIILCKLAGVSKIQRRICVQMICHGLLQQWIEQFMSNFLMGPISKIFYDYSMITDCFAGCVCMVGHKTVVSVCVCVCVCDFTIMPELWSTFLGMMHLRHGKIILDSVHNITYNFRKRNLWHVVKH